MINYGNDTYDVLASNGMPPPLPGGSGVGANPPGAAPGTAIPQGVTSVKDDLGKVWQWLIEPLTRQGWDRAFTGTDQGGENPVIAWEHSAQEWVLVHSGLVVLLLLGLWLAFRQGPVVIQQSKDEK